MAVWKLAGTLESQIRLMWNPVPAAAPTAVAAELAMMELAAVTIAKPVSSRLGPGERLTYSGPKFNTPELLKAPGGDPCPGQLALAASLNEARSSDPCSLSAEPSVGADAS